MELRFLLTFILIWLLSLSPTYAASLFEEDPKIKSYASQISLFYEVEKRPMTDEERSELVEVLEHGKLALRDPYNESYFLAVSAAEVGDLETFKILFRWKIDISRRNSKGDTALTTAIAANKRELVDFLLRFCPISTDLEIKSDSPQAGKSPLVEAARSGQIELTQTLIALGANVNGLDFTGYSAIAAAVSSGNDEIFEKLLEAKADFRQLYNHESLLHLAARNGRSKMVTRLIELGLPVDIRGEVEEATPLHYAAQAGHSGTVQVLLHHRADVNASNNNGITPLGSAVYGETDGLDPREGMMALFTAGANISHLSNSGTSILYLAVENKKPKSVQFLVKNGADLNLEDMATGFTPLVKAVLDSSIDIIGEMLALDADIYYKTHSGFDALSATYGITSNASYRLITAWDQLLKSKTVENFLEAKAVILDVTQLTNTKDLLLKKIDALAIASPLFYPSFISKMKSKKRRLKQCMICQDDKSIPLAEAYEGKGPAGCNCFICEDCREPYIKDVLENSGSDERHLLCPGTSCRQILDSDYFARAGCNDSEVFKLNKAVGDFELSHAKGRLFCKTPDCPGGRVVEEGGEAFYQCALCGFEGCLKCGENHRGECAQAKEEDEATKKRIQFLLDEGKKAPPVGGHPSDPADPTYYQGRYRPCYYCGTITEKPFSGSQTGGQCNSMVCGNPQCGKHWHFNYGDHRFHPSNLAGRGSGEIHDFNLDIRHYEPLKAPHF